MAAGGIQHDGGAEHVGVDEVLRGVNGAVHMALGGKVDDGEKLMLLHQLLDLLGVGDVRVEKFIPRAIALRQARDVGDGPRIGEGVHVGHIGWDVVFKDVPDEVGTDEAAASRDE